MPALLTSTSSRSVACRTSAASLRTWASSARSARTVRGRSVPAVPPISSAARSSFRRSRPCRIRVAPSAASRPARARPRPSVAPVMRIAGRSVMPAPYPSLSRYAGAAGGLVFPGKSFPVRRAADGRGPARPGYEAERMPGRVRIYPGAAVPARQPPGTERQHARLGGGDVVDHDVEMDLLRPARVGPLRRLEIGRQLESDARGFVVAGDDGKVVFLPGDGQAEKLGIEPRERSRVGTVHDQVGKAADHRSILPRAARAAQVGGPRRRLVQLPVGP